MKKIIVSLLVFTMMFSMAMLGGQAALADDLSGTLEVWSSGEELGRCGSMWMLLNLDTRRSVPPGSVSSRMPDNSDMEPTLDHLPIQVQPLAADPEIIPYVPVYSDLDVNGHVNNARYMDLCCNALGIHCMESMQLKHFAINYHAEIRPDQDISLLLRREDNRFSCTGMRDTEACFDICGELAPRN